MLSQSLQILSAGTNCMYNYPMAASIMMATLGSKAQLLTLALDCLRQQGELPGEVVIFHTYRQRPETAQALDRLARDAANLPPCRSVELRGADGPLQDVTQPDEVDCAFRQMYAEVRAAKLNDLSIHLLIAGGRRTVTVFGMAIAQMLFDDSDHLWHLASHPDLEASGALHAGPGEWARLIPIPVIPWGRLSPAFNLLYSVDDPILASNLTRRVDYALFMVEALKNDALIHEAPAIVGCRTPSALAHATVH